MAIEIGALFCISTIPTIVAAQSETVAASDQRTTSSAAYPDEMNTGVPLGIELSKQSGTVHITSDGTVLEAIDLVGNIVVTAKNVTIRNSRITSATPWHLIYVMDGSNGFRLENSELVGNGSTVNGVLGFGTFLRNNIHGFHNGLNIWGPSRIERNYIHDLRGGPDAHFDAIECNGGSDVQIISNTLYNENSQTAALMLNNEFSPLKGWLIDGNILAGGSYTMYIDQRKSNYAVGDIRITNNRWLKGSYGYSAFYDYVPDEWSDNVDDSTGMPISYR